MSMGGLLPFFSDHRPCVSLLSSKHLNRRLMRFALKLQGMDITIKYKPGSTIGNAYGLSRQSWSDGEGAQPFGGCSASTQGYRLAGGTCGSGLQ